MDEAKRTDGSSIPFGLRRSKRKTLAITVRPDLSVWVAAPRRASRALVEERVRRRAVWIRRQQAFFAQFLPHEPPRRFVSGETHRYLGRQYRLKVKPCSSESVKLERGRMVVSTGNKDGCGRIKTQLTDWYRARAAQVFADRLERCWERFRKYGVGFPEVRLKKMQRRWGSCTKRGVIYLNPVLIKTPKSAIDYVILHELCHLKHPDHGKAFQQLLQTLLPEWKLVKQKLEFYQ
ncbi:MAG: M48 family metallopeptidase [Verrucomicrobia bacterium]|nr:M48 family metallopeptidase [Verrucomicrobiota bacterium]